jgi:hypothetical protein
MSNKRKQIAVSEENYLTLKSLGRTADSFNDVVTEVLSRLAHGRDLPLASTQHPGNVDGQRGIQCQNNHAISVEDRSPTSETKT